MDQGQQFGSQNEPVEYSFKPATGRYDSHTISASVGGNQVGSLSWHPKSGRVMGVEVNREYRRQGIASRMWDEAHRAASRSTRVIRPTHSADRTDSGDAWARAVGGTLPRRVK